MADAAFTNPTITTGEELTAECATARNVGFRFAGQYSFNTNTAETAPSDTNTSAYSLASSWGWNLLYIVATYDVHQFASTDSRANAGNPDEKLFQIGPRWTSSL